MAISSPPSHAVTSATRPSPTSTPGLASTKSLRSYPLAERDSLFPYTYCLSSSSLILAKSSTRLLSTPEHLSNRDPAFAHTHPGASPNRRGLCLGIIAWSLLIALLRSSRMARRITNFFEREKVKSLELFRGPNLAPGCSVIAGEKRLQVRQNCLLKDFAAFVCVHRRLIRP
jgi:hypothetical protein